jgi:hypothetical protein
MMSEATPPSWLMNPRATCGRERALRTRDGTVYNHGGGAAAKGREKESRRRRTPSAAVQELTLHHTISLPGSYLGATFERHNPYHL